MTKVRSAGCGKTTTCVAQRIRLIATIVGRPRHSAWNFRLDDKVLYIDDGDIMSSAGRAAGLDHCIHIVRKDFGSEIANDVARRLVIPAPDRARRERRSKMMAQCIC
jgi:hypothetical protein